MNLPALALTAAVSAVAAAQCPFTSVAVQDYGAGCNPVFLTPPTLAVSLDANNCQLLVAVNAFSGCCNTFLSGRVLVLGNLPAAAPLPWLGTGCELLVDPIVLLFQPAAAGATFALPLPPTLLPPQTLFAQGAAVYFTTIGLSTDFALTAGGQVTLL